MTTKPTQSQNPQNNDKQKGSEEYPAKDNPKMEAGIPPKMKSDQPQKKN